MKQQSFLALLYNGKLGVTHVVLYFQTLRLSQRSLTAQIPPGFDNFNPSCTQKSHHSLVPRLVSVPHKLPKTIGHHHFTSVFCSQNHTALRLGDIPSEIQTYLLHNQHWNKAIQKRLTVRIMMTKLRSLYSAAIQFPWTIPVSSRPS